MRLGKKILAVATAVLLSALPEAGHAFGPGSLGRDMGRVNRAYIPTASRIAAPFASIIFCRQNPEECAPTRSRFYAQRLPMNQVRMRDLREVNVKVNKQIRPVNDVGDTWSLEPASGDCEDYAITKRHELIAKGWPSHALRLAVAFTAYGEGHMVLVVKTEQGDLVLDNRYNAVREWNKTGLRWVMIQSPANPARWMQVAANIS